MNLESGIIEIGGVIFSPGYTFDDFKKTPFFENQDGVRTIRLKGTASFYDNNCIIRLFFRNNMLYLISIICIDLEISFSEEPKRKDYHDNILKKIGLDSESYYEWGNIKSVYDPKGNVSSINVIYNVGM